MLKIEFRSELFPMGGSVLFKCQYVNMLTSTHVPNDGEFDLIGGVFLGALNDLPDETFRDAILELGILEGFAKERSGFFVELLQRTKTGCVYNADWARLVVWVVALVWVRVEVVHVVHIVLHRLGSAVVGVRMRMRVRVREFVVYQSWV